MPATSTLITFVEHPSGDLAFFVLARAVRFVAVDAKLLASTTEKLFNYLNICKHA